MNGNSEKSFFKNRETIKLHPMGRPFTKTEYLKHCDNIIKLNSSKKKKIKRIKRFS